MKIHLSTKLRIFVIIVLALGMAGVPGHSAQAVTLTVNSLDGGWDGICDSTNCTLQDAVGASSGGDSIGFDPSLSGTINLNFSIQITGETLTIYGSPTVQVSGQNNINVVVLASGANLTLDGLTIQDGHDPINRNGGAIYVGDSTLSLTNSTIKDSSAPDYGGGIYILNGTVNVTGSTLQNNTSTRGGGIYNDLTSTLTVTNSTFTGNTTGEWGYGGGIDNEGSATVTNSTFTGNSAGANSSGGGIENNGTLMLTNSTFENNTAAHHGGGMENNLSATVTNSTFKNNTAEVYGGGVENNGTATVANSTFWGNSAGGWGGGIDNNGPLTLTNSTLVGNSAAPGEGGGIDTWDYTNFANNIIANNTGGDCYASADSAIVMNINNLVKDGTCSYGGVNFISLQDPLLGALADNGGPTQTMALLYPSPAIDNGDPGSCPSADQRGVSRPRGTACDIGAYEYIPPVACVVTNNADSGAGSLREQIANSSCSTITFDPDLAGFTSLLSTELAIGHNVTVDASALASHFILSGAGSTRVLHVNSGVTVTWDGVDIKNGYAEDGANIYNQGTLTLKNTLVSNGGYYLSGWTGGGIYNDTGATLDLQNSRVSGNISYYGGGGIYNLGTLTVSGSIISDNSSVGSGGGISSEGGSVTVTDSTLQNNSAAGNGGGINVMNGSLTVTHVTFSNDRATNSFGGGINYSSTSDLILTDSTFDSNKANNGGGIALLSGNATVKHSTFSGNYAWNYGGGIVNGNPSTGSSNTLKISNSTFTGNTANNYSGGAIFSRSNSAVGITNSTIAGNSANSSGGGIYIDPGGSGTATLANTIVATSASGGNCSGSIADGGHNLVWGNSTCPGLNADPLLAVLADNGGPTLTMALLSGSPAIDAGDAVICAATPVNNLDQRGMPRPQGLGCDIGSYELQIILYAAPAGLTSGLCESWAHACELRYALTSSVSGQEVWVKTGTYTPTGGTERTATFQLKDGVALYGGFAGSEMLRGQRNPAGYHSILSGEIGAAGSADNSYHVVTGPTGPTGAILDGISITGGNANGAGAYNSGGGVYNTGILAVTGVTFSENTASLDGGAVHNDYGATLHVMRSTFNGNSAFHGGAVNNQDTLVVKESTFSSNQAEVGGAIESTQADLQVKSSTFSGNQAADRGGAINVIQGSFELSNSTLQGNSATNYGGGINHEHGNMWIMSSTLSGNSVSPGAEHFGGGIADQYAVTLYMSNTIIANSTYGGDCLTQLSVVITSVANLVQDGSCSAGLTGDPLLGPLADNGGPTQTMALLSGSPAINAGNNDACIASPVNNLDQRGMTRLVGPLCDIGAYEVNTLYAIPAGLTTGLCDSWAHACKLSYALTSSISGQEIWVAAGTYKPTTATDRSATFQLKSGVALYGGFAGTETARSQRNPASQCHHPERRY